MHPDTEVRFISKEMGYGVVAIKMIPKGTITWVQDELDRVILPEEAEKMHPEIRKQIEKYCFRNSNGELILCWDLAKYVNHSFRANCLSTAYDFEVAVRDIYPGEQLTDDYGYLNIEEPFQADDEGTGRDTVYPDDLLRFHAEWDRQLSEAFRFFRAVDQPLLELVPSGTRRRVYRKLDNQEPLDSILKLYFDENTQK